jgi:YcxB-like protein
LTLTDQSIGVVNPGRAETLAWDQVMHGTITDGGWLFVAKKSNSAVIIPRSALSAKQVSELTAFLSTWPKRRLRRVPARR